MGCELSCDISIINCWHACMQPCLLSWQRTKTMHAMADTSSGAIEIENAINKVHVVMEMMLYTILKSFLAFLK